MYRPGVESRDRLYLVPRWLVWLGSRHTELVVGYRRPLCLEFKVSQGVVFVVRNGLDHTRRIETRLQRRVCLAASSSKLDQVYMSNQLRANTETFSFAADFHSEVFDLAALEPDPVHSRFYGC